MASGSLNWSPSNDLFFKVLLRDINSDMVAAWQDPEVFGEDKFTDLVEVRVHELKRSILSLPHKIQSSYLTLIHQVSCGDIFEDAPATDAIVSLAFIDAYQLLRTIPYFHVKVSPANSFGFMDGGIDMAYSLHFGWQL